MNPSPPKVITLAGQSYIVRVDPQTGKRFVGDEEVGAFIEHMTLLRRTDVLEDLAAIGLGVLRGGQGLVAGSPQMTAFALHQNRTRTN